MKLDSYSETTGRRDNDVSGRSEFGEWSWARRQTRETARTFGSPRVSPSARKETGIGNIRGRSSILCLSLILLLTGCHATKAPDFSYFRLPPPPTVTAYAHMIFETPVVVDTFVADGLYGDQALVYAIDASASELRQYHYQLWVDPPTRMLQRRLLVLLRRAHVSDLVTDGLPASRAAVRVHGVILRMDRMPVDGGYKVAVGLKIRADGVDGAPLLDKLYSTSEPASANGLSSTVAAYGTAIDRLFKEFEADLAQHGGAHHAR